MASQSTRNKLPERNRLAVQGPPKTREERREDKFWECRRTLRIWPVRGDSREDVVDFLAYKLGLDWQFDDEMGEVVVKKVRDPKRKVEGEVAVTFESKEVRDMVEAQAHNLDKYGEEAGMRLQIPNYLQKDFRVLMNLAYNLKKKHPDLKQNVKFDEDNYGLFMDAQVKKDGQWKRVRPEQA